MAIAGTEQRAFNLALDRVLDAHRSSVPVHITSDFDGTLSPFVPFPDESAPLPAARQALVRFASLPGLHALVITGRWLSMMTDVFPESAVDLECSYGLERRIAGEAWQHEQIPEWAPVLESFAAHVEEAVARIEGKTAQAARAAQATDAIYVEMKPTAVAFHDAPALALFPESQAPVLLRRVLETFDGQYEGLLRHDNNGNIEFLAPLELDGELVDKATVMRKLDGVITFSGDDIRDADAAGVVHARDGLVLAVNHRPDGIRRGSPSELLDQADIIFNSVEDHANFQEALSQRVEQEIRPVQ